MYKPYVSKESMKENSPGKESSDSVKKTLVGLKILSGVLVVNTNQSLAMQKAWYCLDKYEIRWELFQMYTFICFMEYFYPVIY